MPDHDPDVSPEQDARLRRLLAGARHVEPLPTDLAARLDSVLAQLEAEERDPRAGRSLVDLAARRRRRVRILLVAAAATVVVSIGVGQVLPTGQDDASSADSSQDGGLAGRSAAESTAGSAGGSAGDTQLAPEDPLPGGAESYASEPSTLTTETTDSTLSNVPSRPHPPVRLSAETFAKQAARLRARPGLRSRDGSVVQGTDLSRAESFLCDTAEWGQGKLLAALYDDVPSVLAYRPVAGETQTVDLLRCGTGEVLRSTVLPVEK